MTCHTYANRPRTPEDARVTAKLFELPSVQIARASYRRGLEQGQKLAEQACNRVRWTVSIATCDAWFYGLAIGLLAGVAIGHWVRL